MIMTLKKMRNKCINCQDECSRPHQKYCSNKCQGDYEYKQYIIRWKKGLETGIRGNTVSAHIKRYLIEKHNNSCQYCGWSKLNSYTQKSILEVHHIDGNYKNNNESNLEILCPNCHALTNNYRNTNKKKSIRKR